MGRAAGGLFWFVSRAAARVFRLPTPSDLTPTLYGRTRKIREEMDPKNVSLRVSDTKTKRRSHAVSHVFLNAHATKQAC